VVDIKKKKSYQSTKNLIPLDFLIKPLIFMYPSTVKITEVLLANRQNKNNMKPRNHCFTVILGYPADQDTN